VNIYLTLSVKLSLVNFIIIIRPICAEIKVTVTKMLQGTLQTALSHVISAVTPDVLNVYEEFVGAK